MQYIFRSDTTQLAFPGVTRDAAIQQLVQLLHPDHYYTERQGVVLYLLGVPHTYTIEEL